MSSGVKRPSAGLEIERDQAERLSPDDLATRREEEFLNDALLTQRLKAEAEKGTTQAGTCTNCREACLPTAVYCDEDCRDDYEKRQAAQRRTGGGYRGTGGHQP
jgi:hypothetical protein